jgi:glyoxylase-like metal-dependent hydrolase (beta-lactamase superfamily II)
MATVEAGGIRFPVASDWWTVRDAGAGITRLVETHVDGLFESNVWHVRGSEADLVVDSANGFGPLLPAIEPLTAGKPVVAVATHGHFDHVGGLREFADRRVHGEDAEMTRSPFPLRILRSDWPAGTEEMYAYYGDPAPEGALLRAVPDEGFDVAGWVAPGAEPSAFVAEGDAIDLGNRRFSVLHTPGHTAGSVCLFDEAEGTLLSGDAVYVDARCSWDDREAFERSLRRLAGLEVSRVHSGHGRSFDGAELRATIDAELRSSGPPG